jgi:hypothetical protein
MAQAAEAYPARPARHLDACHQGPYASDASGGARRDEAADVRPEHQVLLVADEGAGKSADPEPGVRARAVLAVDA